MHCMTHLSHKYDIAKIDLTQIINQNIDDVYVMCRRWLANGVGRSIGMLAQKRISYSSSLAGIDETRWGL